MKDFDLKKYLAESKLFEEKKGGFAFWYRSGARGEKNALQARELLTQKGIDADYSKGPYYIDFSKSDAEESVVTQLLQDANLTNFVILRDDEGAGEDLAEGKLNENRPHPTEVFTDEELDYIGDMMVAMYEKLGLADEEDPSSTNVVKALALSDRIEGFFETLN